MQYQQLIAAQTAEHHRFLGGAAQRLQKRLGMRGDVELAMSRQPHQRRAEPYPTMAVDFQQVFLGQRIDQPLDGRARQIVPGGDLPQAHTLLTAFQALENRRPPGHDLHATTFSCGHRHNSLTS